MSQYEEKRLKQIEERLRAFRETDVGWFGWLPLKVMPDTVADLVENAESDLAFLVALVKKLNPVSTPLVTPVQLPKPKRYIIQRETCGDYRDWTVKLTADDEVVDFARTLNPVNYFEAYAISTQKVSTRRFWFDPRYMATRSMAEITLTWFEQRIEEKFGEKETETVGFDPDQLLTENEAQFKWAAEPNREPGEKNNDE